tara:strand:- start:73 stop:255 length:183 start_codon:yes stop_codon:yes gene_type:complete
MGLKVALSLDALNVIVVPVSAAGKIKASGIRPFSNVKVADTVPPFAITTVSVSRKFLANF